MHVSMRSPVKPVRKGAQPNARPMRTCYILVGSVTLILGVMLAYGYIFRSLRQWKRSSPQSAGAQIIDTLDSYVTRCPKTDCTAVAKGDVDPDAWLDTVGEHPPPIVPSHYAQVHGIEPFERSDVKPFDLHVIPTDEWYDRAKRATDRCDLELTQQVQGGSKGLADKIVWVSGLFDLKRGEGGNGDFQRSMEEYYARFQRVLDRGFEMVIYIPRDFEAHLRIDKSRIHIVYMNTTDLHTYFPYFERLTAIRLSKLWNDQAVQTGWLSNAPQARLAEYNPLVMSKLKMVRDAARLNPFGARYHLWMDAGHLCAGEQNPTPAGTSMYRKHMASGFFVTHWPYGTTTEVHGLTDKAMHLYMAQAEDPLRIVRGGIFGGTLPYIECVLRAYTLALHQTMMDGYVGTEECIWAIIHARFPHLFKSFDNNSLGGHGDNCASFTASKMEEQEVIASKKTAFVSPDIPKYPTWWDEAQRGGGSGGGSGSGGKGGSSLRVEAALKRVGGVKTK